VEEALIRVVTSMLGGGTGPAHGTFATTCSRGPWHIGRMMQPPMAAGQSRLRRQGQCLAPGGVGGDGRGGACSLKLHEDWGTTPAAIDCCLAVRRRLRRAVMIHTDTLNESGVRRGYHQGLQGPHHPRPFHTEGAGGGHAPDIIKVAASRTCLPSSTNPTRPFTRNTIDEHLDS